MLAVAFCFLFAFLPCSFAQPKCPLLTSANCTSLGGFMNGARCFYFMTTPVNWTYAWTVCEESGGALAQIHTQSEWTAVVAKASASGFWLALVADPNADQTSCETLNRGNYYWFDGPSAKNQMLTLRDTWIRYHLCDDLDDKFANETCHAVNMFDCMVDRNCVDTDVLPLCFFNTQKQEYTKTSYCMNETSLETISGIDDIQHCAEICTQRIWCRSFNFRPDPQATCENNVCELFSWSTLDPCPKCPRTKAGTAGCIHYNYVP